MFNLSPALAAVVAWARTRKVRVKGNALPEQEFSLPYFEFVYHEHWDLGRVYAVLAEALQAHLQCKSRQPAPNRVQ